jgi:hypothetical protein
LIFLKHTSPNRLFWYILLPAHFILLSLLYTKFGFNLSQEGDKYLSGAHNLIAGSFSKAFEYQTFSSFYIIYLSFFLFLKLPAVCILLFTYMLNLTACLSFYKLLKELISEVNAKVWLTLMLLSPMLQYWQLNLFSETFFIAISLLFISSVLRTNTKNRAVKAFFLALVLILTRPGGILVVVPVLALYALWHKPAAKKLILTACFLSGLLLFYVIIFELKLHYPGVSSEVAGGSVYAGFPTLKPVNFPKWQYTLWNCYQNIIEQNGLATLNSLFLRKWESFFVITRPYYTFFHNFINAFHYLFYGFSIAAIYLVFKLKHIRASFFLSLMGIIFLNSLMVALTFNEWSERYTVQVFPFIFVLSAFPISLAIHKLKNKRAV